MIQVLWFIDSPLTAIHAAPSHYIYTCSVNSRRKSDSLRRFLIPPQARPLAPIPTLTGSASEGLHRCPLACALALRVSGSGRTLLRTIQVFHIPYATNKSQKQKKSKIFSDDRMLAGGVALARKTSQKARNPESTSPSLPASAVPSLASALAESLGQILSQVSALSLGFLASATPAE